MAKRLKRYARGGSRLFRALYVQWKRRDRADPENTPGIELLSSEGLLLQSSDGYILLGSNRESHDSA